LRDSRTTIEISSSTHCNRPRDMRSVYRRKLVIVNAIILFRGSHQPVHLISLTWESQGKTQQCKGKYSHWWKKPKINPAFPGLIGMFYHDTHRRFRTAAIDTRLQRAQCHQCVYHLLLLPLSSHKPASKKLCSLFVDGEVQFGHACTRCR